MVKAVKTADELQDMILERARENFICPPGMAVRVRPIRMSWAIDCVPPTTSKDAHADCYELMNRIAADLREQYDLGAAT